MTKLIHTFENGVKVYDYHLLDSQRERYEKRNVHEPDEEDIFVKIVNSIPPKGYYINIGSAIGYYPILAKKLSASIIIHAYEPLEIHRKYFTENIRLNGFAHEDFYIHEEAVSSSDGYAKLADKRYGSHLAKHETFLNNTKYVAKHLLAYLGLKNFPRYSHSKVKTLTLDSLIKDISRTVDLIQMDIQGHEVEALQGGLQSLKSGLINTVLIGTHHLEKHKECIGILKNHAYLIEFEEYETEHQPDGIIVASRGVQRLSSPNCKH